MSGTVISPWNGKVRWIRKGKGLLRNVSEDILSSTNCQIRRIWSLVSPNMTVSGDEVFTRGDKVRANSLIQCDWCPYKRRQCGCSWGQRGSPHATGSWQSSANPEERPHLTGQDSTETDPSAYPKLLFEAPREGDLLHISWVFQMLKTTKWKKLTTRWSLSNSPQTSWHLRIDTVNHAATSPSTNKRIMHELTSDPGMPFLTWPLKALCWNPSGSSGVSWAWATWSPCSVLR